MIKARNGHYEPIMFYDASWEIDQIILPQIKHTNQSKNCPLNNEVKKKSLSLYGIDDNMHLQK
jgi:hypothetical protein